MNLIHLAPPANYFWGRHLATPLRGANKNLQHPKRKRGEKRLGWAVISRAVESPCIGELSPAFMANPTLCRAGLVAQRPP